MSSTSWDGTAPTGTACSPDAMRAFVETTGGTPIQITSHPVRFGSGDWTCVVGVRRWPMVTVAKWRDGTIAELVIGTVVIAIVSVIGMLSPH